MYYFIVNEHGGSGKAAKCWNIIKNALNKKNIDYKYYVPEAVSHATELAKRISEFEDDDIRLVVVGGDGTVNEVLNGISDFERVKFGFIPTGSGNDFGRGLRLPRHNPLKALNIILDSTGDKSIDLGMVENNGKRKYFAISSGFGLNALVGTSVNTSKIKIVMNKLHLSKMSYGLLTLKYLFTMKTQNVDLSFDGEPLIAFSDLIFIAVMNFKAEGGGVPMAPSASENDGLLSICVASGIPRWRTFFVFPFLVAGKHGNKKGFTLKNCKTLDVYSKTPSVCHTDGELFGNEVKLHYECLPSKLKVLI